MIPAGKTTLKGKLLDKLLRKPPLLLESPFAWSILAKLLGSLVIS